MGRIKDSDYEANNLTKEMNEAIKLYIQALEDKQVPVIAHICEAVGKQRSAWYVWIKKLDFREELLEQVTSKIGIDTGARLSIRISQDDVATSDLVKIHTHSIPKKLDVSGQIKFEELLAEMEEEDDEEDDKEEGGDNDSSEQ